VSVAALAILKMLPGQVRGTHFPADIVFPAEIAITHRDHVAYLYDNLQCGHHFDGRNRSTDFRSVAEIDLDQSATSFPHDSWGAVPLG